MTTLLFALTLALQSTSQPVTLGWNRNPAAENVAEYRLYLDGDPPLSMGNPTDDASCGCPTFVVQLPPGTHVMYITAVNSGGESGPSNSISTTIGEANPPPSPPSGFRIVQGPPPPGTVTFYAADVGSSQPPGTSSASNGNFVLSSAGLDTWGTVDSFHFVFTDKSGDGQIVARVNSLDNTHWAAKAGLMWRESTAANSRAVQLNVNPNGAIEFMQRTNTGGNMQWISGAGAAAFPRWLRLVRAGGTITGYASVDGLQWTVVGSTATQMAPAVKLGLFTLSHASGVTANAGFDNVTVP